MRQGQPVLMDTSVIIESFRTGCWNAIAGHFAIELVETCFAEARSGDPQRPGYVVVGGADFERGVRARHPVSSRQRAELMVGMEFPDTLDAGELDLLAHLKSRTDDWVASCADRAAVNAALALGWGERFVSLQALARAVGAKPDLKHHFTEGWLSEVRTDHLLGRRP